MSEQRETIRVEVVETGADAATSKVERLNATMAKTGQESTRLKLDLNGVVSSLQDLGKGGEGTLAGLQSLKSIVVQNGTSLGSYALASTVAADRLKNMTLITQAFTAAQGKVAAANDVVAAAFARVNEAHATYLKLKAEDGAGARAAPGSAEAAARKAARDAVSTAHFAYKDTKSGLASAQDDLAMASSAASAARLTNVLGVLAGGAAAAGVAVAGAFSAIAMSARSAADDNAELADKLGLSMKQLEVMKLVAGENSGTLEGLQHVYDKLSKSMTKLDEDSEKARYAFEVLGLSQSDMAGQSEQAIAGTIIKNWELLERSGKATTAVAQLLGPAFRDQVPAIKAAATGMDEYQKRIETFGSVASKDLIEAGGRQEVALGNLGIAWRNLAQEVAASAGETLSSASNFFATLLKEQADAMAKARQFKESLKDPVNKATQDKNDAQADMAKYEGQGGYLNIFLYERARKKYDAAVIALNAASAKKIADEAAKATKDAEEAAALKAEKAAVKARSDAAKPPVKPGAERSAYDQGIEALSRERDLRKDATIYEKTLFETQRGRYKDLSASQKKHLLDLSKEADVQVLIRGQQEETLKGLKEFEREEERVNEQLKQRITYENQLAAMTAKRLKQAGNDQLLGASIQRGQAGMSGIDKQAENDTIRVIQEAQAAIDELSPYLEDYQSRVDDIRRAEEEATQAIRDAAKQRKEYNADWTNGAKSAFATYLDDVQDVAKNTETLFTKAFSKSEDAINSFVTTGKMDVKGLVASILQDMASYLIRMTIIAPIVSSLKAMMGFADGGAFEGGAQAFAKGAAFSGGVKAFAGGGVVTSPTLFPMAGGSIGLMGEAGPEAIMPLDRDSKGRLGVKASGGGMTQNTYAISISIGSVDSPERVAEMQKALEMTIKAEAKKTIAEEMRRGNSLNRRH